MNTLQVVGRMGPSIAARALSTSARAGSVSMKQSFTDANAAGMVPTSEGYQRLRELQNEFHSTPDKMVWQKRGLRDLMPFQLTALLCVSGLGLALYNLYDMSFPKPPQ